MSQDWGLGDLVLIKPREYLAERLRTQQGGRVPVRVTMLAYAGSYQIITYRHDDGSFVLLGIPHEWDLDMFCGVWKQVSFNEAEELLLRGETLLTRGGAYVEYDEKLKRNCAKYVLEDKSDMLRGLYRKRGEEAEY